MTTPQQITVDNLIINIVRKNVKNLRLTVYARDNSLRITAPIHTHINTIRSMIKSNLAWIQQQQAKFQTQQPVSKPRYISGERHYVAGQAYQLNVISHHAAPKVDICHHQAIINLYVRTGSDETKRQQILTDWYRKQLKAKIPVLIAKWQPIIGVQVLDWGIKQMKTKWGTCNITKQRIWINLALARKSEHCLEYIIVHEMVHLLERYHNQRFKAYMDQFLPNWRDYKKELNQNQF